jgi:hypothetical protein
MLLFTALYLSIFNHPWVASSVVKYETFVYWNFLNYHITLNDISIHSCVTLNTYKENSVFQQEEDSLHQQIRLAKEESSELLQLEHSFVWCGNLDSSEARSEIPGKFWNVVLEKNGEDKLDGLHK